MVDSCKQCEECEAGLENYCDHMILTYNGPTADAPDTPSAAIRSRLWYTSATCCIFAIRRNNSPPWRRCSARGLPPTLRCATGTSGRGKSRHCGYWRVGTYGN
jgi:hypothetical protein